MEERACGDGETVIMLIAEETEVVIQLSGRRKSEISAFVFQRHTHTYLDQCEDTC